MYQSSLRILNLPKSLQGMVFLGPEACVSWLYLFDSVFHCVDLQEFEANLYLLLCSACMCRTAPLTGSECAGALTNLHIAVCGGNPETNKIYWKWFCKYAAAQHHLNVSKLMLYAGITAHACLNRIRCICHQGSHLLPEAGVLPDDLEHNFLSMLTRACTVLYMAVWLDMRP